jgi:uncharacterized protein YcbX
MSTTIATVAQLFVYPIKSMAGVPVEQAHVGLDGILGDRLYSFVRAGHAAKNSFPWMTARDATSMLLYKPELAQAPTPEKPEPEVKVKTPAGETLDAGDDRLTAELAAAGKQPLFLLKSARGIFDCQHVSLFSRASVDGLSAEAGCPIDHRQFRANIYMDPASGTAFEEESWTSCLLAIGDEVVLGITQRDTRCMMINLDPTTGVQDPRVLKTVAQSHQGQAGLYANVVRPGAIRTGDAIRVVSKLQ